MKKSRITLITVLMGFSILWVITLNPRIEAIMGATIYGVMLYSVVTNKPSLL